MAVQLLKVISRHPIGLTAFRMARSDRSSVARALPFKTIKTFRRSLCWDSQLGRLSSQFSDFIHWPNELGGCPTLTACVSKAAVSQPGLQTCPPSYEDINFGPFCLLSLPCLHMMATPCRSWNRLFRTSCNKLIRNPSADF